MVDFPGERFQVSWSERNRQTVRNLGRQAIEAGTLTEFVQTIKHIEEQLAQDPLAWGDPYHHLKATNITLCQRIYGGVHIFFAVDEDNRLVYVKDIMPFPRPD